MQKEAEENKIGIIAIVLAVVGIGFIYKLSIVDISLDFVIIFMLLLGILYVLLKDVRLN